MKGVKKVIGLEDKVDRRWTDTGNKAEGERREGEGKMGDEKDKRR